MAGLVVACAAGRPNRALAQDVEATPQRPSFTSNTAITHAGTMELESGIQGSGSERSFVNLIKYTPSASVLGGRVEFAIEFDALAHDESGIRFGDDVRLQARAPIGERGPASFAVLPFAVVPTRSGNGPGQVGGTLITTIESGPYGGDVNVTLAKATGVTPLDAVAGNVALAFGRMLGGEQGKFGLYTSAIGEFGRNRGPHYSLLEGVTYTASPRVTLDVSLGQFEIGEDMELAIVAGATVNFGYVSRWFRTVAAPARR